MHPLQRPSTVLALALSAVATTGCPFPTFGCSGDLSFENREMEGTFELDDENMVQLLDGPVDPLTEEGCEAMCSELGWGQVTEVHACSVEMPEEIQEADEAPDTGDTGYLLGERRVMVACVTSGEDYCVGGRHSATLSARASGRGQSAVAAWLAREACGEAGSVQAFRQLAAELRHHGAPEALISAAENAMRDEIHHAQLVRALAKQKGGQPERVRAVPQAPRDLLTVALENAVEGCVHETFAAARAGFQASHAEDEAVREVSAVLARDEFRHADLAADVHAWAVSVLPAEQAAQVEQARQDAWARMMQEPIVEDEQTRRALGLPDEATQRRLVRVLSGALVSRAA